MRKPVSKSHQLHSGVCMDWWIDSCHFSERVRRIWQYWLSSLNAPVALSTLNALSLQFDGHVPWYFSPVEVPQIQFIVRVLDILV